MNESGAGSPPLRAAGPDDVPAIEALMRVSILELFSTYYDAAQTAASVASFASLDRVLIEDGTYFVIEVDGELVACGGWTRRARVVPGSGDDPASPRFLDPATEPARIRQMFVRPDWARRGLATRLLETGEAAARKAGFRRLELGASLPGEPLYLRYGFREIERIGIPLSDGASIEGVHMAKPIE